MAFTPTVQQLKQLYPWMPAELAQVWLEAFVETDDTELALQEVRNGEGRKIYDSIFPANRRDDGTLRLSEAQYLTTVQSYRNSLARRGLNPAVFADRFPDLIRNEVWSQEFEQRVEAVNQNIGLQSAPIREAFAQAAGLPPEQFSREAILATVLDPEGVGRELLARRISVAQVRGAAAEFGFARSQERADQIVEQAQLNLAQAREFFSQASAQVDPLSDLSRRFERPGQQGVGVDVLEEAFLLRSAEQQARIENLLTRERATFSRTRGLAETARSGAVTGLSSGARRS